MTTKTRVTRTLVATGTVLAALLVPVVGGFAADNTLYVDRSNPSCSNSGAGTAAQPFCTIGAAASRATAGKTVEVASGTYPEVVTVATSGTSLAPIVFKAAPGATVTVSGQANGFVVWSRSWITISGFNVTNTSDNGIRVSDSTRITLTGNQVSFSGRPSSGNTAEGMRLSNLTDSTVSGNTTHHNTEGGIVLDGGSTRNMVSGNLAYSNAQVFERAAPGIRLYSAPGNTIANNIAHHNEDSGIEFYSGSNNSLAYNNVTYDNGDHGIDNNNCKGQRIVSNSVYRNVTAGINLEGSSSGGTVANNVSVDNGIDSPRTKSNIRFDSTSVSGATMNSDLVHLRTPGVMLVWSSTSYASVAALRAATGQESRGIEAAPRWASPNTGDFHLTSGSPAIDSADSGVSGQPSADVEGTSRFDHGATPNTGIGPRAYDDRGAYELGPQGDAPPSASLTVSPASGTINLPVTADASASTDTDATPIASYRFDFGDGSPAVGPQPGATANHTYTQPGDYTVTVTVTDTAGLSSSATRTVSVRDNPPVAVLGVDPSSGIAPLDVTADASASTDGDATPIASYRFDFGDGSAAVGPQSGAVAAHTYPLAGTYTVTVTVRDTAGLSSTATRTVQVNPAGSDLPPAAALSVSPGTGTAPLAVTANASASTDTDATPIASYRFDFGDGTVVGPQPGATAGHTYTSAGSRTVTVTVTDTAGLQGTATASVQVTASANLVSNPGFEVNTAGWNISSSSVSGVVLARVAGGHSGSASAKVTHNGSSTGAAILNDSPNWVLNSTPGTYTTTLWVRADTPGAPLKLKVREYRGSSSVGSASAVVTLTALWQPLTVNYTVASAGSTLDLNAYISSAAPGTSFYADDVSITRN